MKTRMGFVSNSSSSSFVLVGRKLSGYMEYLSLTEEEQKKVWIFGGYGYEGEEGSILNSEIAEAMETYEPWEISSEFEFWLTALTGEYITLKEDLLLEAGVVVDSRELDYYQSWGDSSNSFHNFMKERGYGDTRSDEEKRMEDILNEN